MDELRALGNIVAESIRKIEESCSKRDVTLPSLITPFAPESELANDDPVVRQASADIIAAAAQLTALLRPPPVTLMTQAIGFHISSAMRLVTELNVPEILREAGPKGLPINVLAERAKTNANKLGRALRLLATEHIFTEVAPDVFANNRISSVLDTGKSVAEVQALKPEDKYPGSNCAGALISHCTDPHLKSSAFLTDTLLKPEYVNSFSDQKTAFNIAYKTDLSFWNWIEQPGNEYDLKIFASAMEGMTNFFVRNSMPGGFNWKTVPEGGVVVDVGGGVGSQSMVLAKANPHLKFILQDREAVIPQSQKFWESSNPEAIEKGQITFQAHNFFDPQPVPKPSIFFMRFILHDWSDEDSVRILRHLRAAAGPETQLVIVDMILTHACEEDANSLAMTIPGSDAGRPPKPLLANGGHANAIGYRLDFHMLTVHNGQERTLAQLNRVLSESGWRLVRVYRTPYYTGGHPQALAIPV